MIKLRDDVVFSDPESRIREYCEIEIYQGYDDKHSIDNIITKRDIDVANNIYAMIGRYDKDENKRLLRHSKSITRFLNSIPNVDIHDVVDSEWPRLRRRIEELLIEFLSIKGIGLSKATKILHLKRPNLIPVLDSHVINFLLGINISDIEKRRQVDRGLQALDRIRKTIINQRSAFEKLAEETRDLPIQLTIIRLFDILCWTAEKWDIRGNTNAPYGHASKSLLQTSKKENPLIGKKTINRLADQIETTKFYCRKCGEEYTDEDRKKEPYCKCGARRLKVSFGKIPESVPTEIKDYVRRIFEEAEKSLSGRTKGEAVYEKAFILLALLKFACTMPRKNRREDILRIYKKNRSEIINFTRK